MPLQKSHPLHFTASLAAVLLIASSTARAADPITVPAADFPRPAHPEIGVNLEGVVDYAHSMVFVDTLKSARKFGSLERPWDETCTVDDHGWPTTDAGIVIMADTAVPPGDYIFSCTGRCEPKLVNTNGNVKTIQYDPPSNTTAAIMTINAGANNLFLGFAHTNGGVKNIRLLRPGYPLDTQEVFTKEFLAAIQPFSTLRLMDFTQTNNSDVTDWSDRTKPDDALQSGKRGVAWEYGIQLANTAKKDLWINIPDRATDDYVRQLATLLKAKLDKDRSVYIEYSNEVWNGSFKQSGHNADDAKKEVAGGDKKLNDGGKDDNPYYWAWKRVAKKLMDDTATFKDVWGADQINKRIRPVLASQSANSFMARMQVDFIDKNYGPPSQFIYGVAGAPYFGPEGKLVPQDHATVDDLIKATNVNGTVKDWSTQYLVLARYYRIHHLCYEGGLALDGEHDLAAKIALNRDPHVTQLMTDYFNMWYGQGGELFMYYNLAGTYNKYGCWGLTDDIRVTTPKQTAVLNLAKGPKPALTTGAQVPGVIQAVKFDYKDGGNVENSKDGGKNLAYLHPGHTFDYVLNVKDAGIYSLNLQAASESDDAAVETLLSGTSVGTLKTPHTADTQTWTDSQPTLVKLQKGQIVLRLRVASGGMNIRSITFARR